MYSVNNAEAYLQLLFDKSYFSTDCKLSVSLLCALILNRCAIQRPAISARELYNLHFERVEAHDWIQWDKRLMKLLKITNEGLDDSDETKLQTPLHHDQDDVVNPLSGNSSSAPQQSALLLTSAPSAVLTPAGLVLNEVTSMKGMMKKCIVM